MTGRAEQDLAQMEALLRQLEQEYDQFFCGLRREPTATENAFLALERSFAGRSIQNSTLAFRHNTLIARYHAFRSVWSRRLREREEGRSAPRSGGPRTAPPRAVPRTVAHGGAPLPEYLTSDPLREQRHLLQFFETYRRMREASGESNTRLRPESFSKALAEKVEKIRREHQCESVLVRVVTEQGRTRLVAKPFRPAPSPQ